MTRQEATDIFLSLPAIGTVMRDDTRKGVFILIDSINIGANVSDDNCSIGVSVRIDGERRTLTGLEVKSAIEEGTYIPLTDNPQEYRAKAETYDRVCKQLGIENNILVYVENLWREIEELKLQLKAKDMQLKGR